MKREAGNRTAGFRQKGKQTRGCHWSGPGWISLTLANQDTREDYRSQDFLGHLEGRDPPESPQSPLPTSSSSIPWLFLVFLSPYLEIKKVNLRLLIPGTVKLPFLCPKKMSPLRLNQVMSEALATSLCSTSRTPLLPELCADYLRQPQRLPPRTAQSGDPWASRAGVASVCHWLWGQAVRNNWALARAPPGHHQGNHFCENPGSYFAKSHLLQGWFVSPNGLSSICSPAELFILRRVNPRKLIWVYHWHNSDHPSTLLFFVFFFLWVFCLFFRAKCMEYVCSQARGWIWSCSCWPVPQSEQHHIQATSVTYPTALCNARSLTHWARPGIEPASSWILVGSISTGTQ